MTSPIVDQHFVVLGLARQGLAGHQGLFQFAVAHGLVALDSPLVLDPMYRDFSSDRIEKALRSVGGKAAPIKRARKRRKGNG